jgi:hypothetical protein
MKIGPNPEQLLKDTPSAKRPDQDGDGMTVTVEKIVGRAILWERIDTMSGLRSSNKLTERRNRTLINTVYTLPIPSYKFAAHHTCWY